MELRMFNNYYPILLLLALFTMSCKGKKQLVSSTKLAPQTTEFLQQQLAENQVQAEWLMGKMKVNFNNNGQQQKAFSTIKMRKDSVIWMNVKKLGIEGARLQVTPDSVYLIDRINGEYMVKGLSFITEKLNLPANFSMLQNFLLGNAVFFTRDLTAANDDLNYQLLGENETLATQYWLNGISYQLTKMYVIDKTENRRLMAQFSNYQPLNEQQNFSYFRDIDVDSTEMGKVNVRFDFTEVKLNEPTTIRFSIPNHYQRVD
ncbi:MAG: DUF4292 domain-containing protein [Saprospiraceae bacterium]